MVANSINNVVLVYIYDRNSAKISRLGVSEEPKLRGVGVHRVKVLQGFYKF